MLDLGHESLACRVLVPPRPSESRRPEVLERLPVAGLLGPTPREWPQVERQPRSCQAPRRAGRARTGKWGAPVTTVSIPNAHWQEGPWERALGREFPYPGPEILTDQHAQHVQQHEDPPPLHVAPAQGRPRLPLVPVVPERPSSPRITWPWRLPGPGKGLGLKKGPERGGGGAGGGRGTKRKCGGRRGRRGRRP